MRSAGHELRRWLLGGAHEVLEHSDGNAANAFAPARAVTVYSKNLPQTPAQAEADDLRREMQRGKDRVLKLEEELADSKQREEESSKLAEEWRAYADSLENQDEEGEEEGEEESGEESEEEEEPAKGQR